MRVNHSEDHITHAVIGGQKTIDMGIANSAEFFQILSQSLYSNQPLAVVREVMCNAWDAHIDAGITDRPIEVSVGDAFVVRDFGKGIPHDMIGPIYGVYGASTKVHDANSTGGFGLGCKSPFAYTDHFQVISCHDGIKTVYSMSKASMDGEGKPGIIPVVSMPTDETGITVTVPLDKDRGKFIQYVKQVAYNGEILVKFGDEILPVLPMSKSEVPFVLTGYSYGEDAVRLRYGNVVYPIPNHEAYQIELSRLLSRIEKIRRHIVLMAPPNTISVTPSRESLSMQDRTIETVKTLLQQAIKAYDDAISNNLKRLCQETIEEQVQNNNIAPLLNNHRTYLSHKESADPITTKEGIAQIVGARLIVSNDQYAEDARQIVTKIANKVPINKRGKYDTYLRTKDKSAFLQDFYKGLFKDVASDGLDINRVVIADGMDTWKLCEVGTYPFKHWKNPIQLIERVMILSRSYKLNFERLDRFPMFKGANNSTYVFYHLPRTKEANEVAKAVFEKRGWTVIDLTQIYPWETELLILQEAREREREANRKNPKPKAKTKPKSGLVRCSSGLFNGIPNRSVLKRSTDFIDKPEFYMPRPWDTRWIYNISEPRMMQFLKFYGSKGGFTISHRQEDKLKEQGIVDWFGYLKKQIEELTKIPHIQMHLAEQKFINNNKGSIYLHETRQISENEYLRNGLGFPKLTKLTEEEAFLINIGNIPQFSFSISIRSALDAIPAADYLERARGTFYKKEFLRVFDIDQLCSLNPSIPSHKEILDTYIDLFKR